MNNYKTPSFLILFVLITTIQVNAYHNNKSINPIEKGTEVKKNNPIFYFQYNPILEEIVLTCKNSKYTAEIYDNNGKVLKQVFIKKDSTSKISLLGFKHGKYFLRYIGENKFGNSSKILYIN